MRTKVKLGERLLWLGPLGVAVLAIAGCIGRSGVGLPGTESHDTLEHVTAANFEERVLKCEKPVLVDFYAEWCNPCKRLTPIVEEFAAEHPEARVVKVNVDDCPELAQRYEVSGMPTLLTIRDGKVVARSVGLVSKSRLHELIGGGTADNRG